MNIKTGTIIFGASGAFVSLLALAFTARRASAAADSEPGNGPNSIPSYPVDVDWGLGQRPNMSMASTPAPASTTVNWGLTKPAPNFQPALPAPAQTMPAAAAAPATKVNIGPAQRITDAAPPAPAQATRSPSDAARALFAYVSPLIRAGNLDALGTKENPNEEISIMQRDMRVIRSDGVYGPKTAARGKELLGREFPARTRPANTRVQTPAPQAPKVAIRYSPEQAAEALYLLVTHPPVDWGTKARPNSLIEAAQHDMGDLVADGIYGPRTQARGTVLTHKKFPTRN